MLITAAVSKDGKSAWNSDIGSIDGSNGPYDKIQETFWREGKFVLWSLSRYLISWNIASKPRKIGIQVHRAHISQQRKIQQVSCASRNREFVNRFQLRRRNILEVFHSSQAQDPHILRVIQIHRSYWEVYCWDAVVVSVYLHCRDVWGPI